MPMPNLPLPPMSYNVRDFIHEADAQLGRYGQNLSRFHTLAGESEGRSSDLQRRLAEACVQLADALLPDFSEAGFQALSTKLGVPELLSLYRQYRQHEAQLVAQVDAIEQSDDYTGRESVRARLETQLEEVKPLFEYAARDLQYLESLPGLHELVERGYGTPQYAHQGILRYFSPEYMRDWRRSDEICETLKLATFPEVAARYRERREEAEVLGRTVNELQSKLRQIADLEAERERLLSERAALPGALRRDAGKRLAALLQGNPALVDGLEFPDTLRSRVREIDGLEHQIKYLDAVRLRVQEDMAQLQERSDKLRMERDRYAENAYRYRNKTFTQEQFAKRFRRDDRYDNLYNRYARTSQTIYVFHDYDRASPLEDFLWWDVMTDGRLNGGYIPEVQTYYEEHPDYSYDRSALYTGAGVGAGMSGSDFSGDFGDSS